MSGAFAITHALPRFALAAAAALLCTGGALRAETILPTQQGATWEYQVRDSSRGGTPEPLTVRINGVEQVGAKELLKLETLAGDAVAKTELISVDERGVHCHQRAGADGKATILEPPQTIVPAPLKVGVTWQVNDHVAGGGTQQFTVVGAEDIAVPAGSFRAFRVRCEQPWPISTTTERWFAPGTGTIKDITTTRGPTGRLLSRTTTILTEFSIALPEEDKAPPPEETEPSPAPVAESTPPPKPGILLEVAGERDAPPQTEFKSDAPQIFVKWSGVNLPPGGTIRVAWVAEDVGDIAPADFVIDEMATAIETAEFGARFTLSRPKDGWAAGKYRVEVYLEDELLQKLGVTITD